MLPENTILGQLEIFEIYENLDGPRLFAVRNNIGTMYLAFWFDEEADATGWLYLPISETKLSKLRRKEISLKTAFENPEMNYYLVYTGIPPRQDSAKLVNPTEISADFFPPKGYFIEYVDVVNERTDGWSFESILSGEKISAESIAQFIGRFRELAEDIMSNLSGKIPQLYPQSASPGSIKIKFSSDNDTYAIKSLEIIDKILTTNSLNEFRNILLEYKINTSQLRDFLNSILRNRLTVELAPKLAADGEAFKLNQERIRQCIRYLDEVSYSTIDSIKIPQANDIDKVITVLKMINNGVPLIHENIEGLTSRRQVQYYRAAAYALGLTTKDNQLTAAGNFIISHSEKMNQYQILADRFESTDFGWAWMKWAHVKYMTELDPNTAADFLMTSVPGLSEDTATRRATTLKKWLAKLKPYHRKYQN